jgi:uncharacterized membrane protein
VLACNFRAVAIAGNRFLDVFLPILLKGVLGVMVFYIFINK